MQKTHLVCDIYLSIEQQLIIACSPTLLSIRQFSMYSISADTQFPPSPLNTPETANYTTQPRANGRKCTLYHPNPSSSPVPHHQKSAKQRARNEQRRLQQLHHEAQQAHVRRVPLLRLLLHRYKLRMRLSFWIRKMKREHRALWRGASERGGKNLIRQRLGLGPVRQRRCLSWVMIIRGEVHEFQLPLHRHASDRGGAVQRRISNLETLLLSRMISILYTFFNIFMLLSCPPPSYTPIPLSIKRKHHPCSSWPHIYNAHTQLHSLDQRLPHRHRHPHRYPRHHHHLDPQRS